MIRRKQSFWQTVLLVAPLVWSFLGLTQYNELLKIPIFGRIILLIALIVYAFDKDKRRFKNIRKCFNFFAVFAAYLFVVTMKNDVLLFSIDILLIIATTFSFSFLGYEFKRYSIVGYLYAAVSAVIILDFNLGGLTAGFNTNTIAMYSISGVMFLLVINDMQKNRFIIFNGILVITLLSLISVTGCRSVFVGFYAYLILRYIFFGRKKITKFFFKTVATVSMLLPYVIMQVYMYMYNNPNREEIDKFFKEHTGKILFTERELIWKSIFKNLTGEYYWLGTGNSSGNPHNLYVDIWRFCGLIGVVGFIILFLIIIFKMYKYISDPIIKSSICCFLGYIISETFECVFFTLAVQNMNIILYLIIAIGIGRYMYLEGQSKDRIMARNMSE